MSAHNEPSFCMMHDMVERDADGKVIYMSRSNYAMSAPDFGEPQRARPRTPDRKKNHTTSSHQFVGDWPAGYQL